MFKILRHWFTPHQSNNHKAKALHSQAFIFYILLVFTIQVSLKTVKNTFPNILGYATSISTDTLLNDTNQKRLSAGLSSLSISPTLAAAAANKASDMFSKNYWAHVAPDGRTPWDFITGAGYRYVYAGENLAKNFNDSSAVVEAWMNSPSHRDNIMKKEYKEVGFAIVNGKLNGEETTLVVQMFGSPTNSPSSPAQTVTTGIRPTVPPIPTQQLSLITPILTVGQVAQVLPTISSIPPTAIPPTTSLLPTVSALANTNTGTNQLHIAGIQSLPVFSVTSITRMLSLGLIGFLLLILGIDSFLIFKRRTIRVSGHNFAHMLFLLMLVGVLYLTGSGVIL